MIKDAVQLRERWARAFSLPGYALSFDPVSVEVSKSRDLACDISTFRLTLMDERGNPVTRVGKALTVWQKRAGHWKVVAEAPNYDN